MNKLAELVKGATVSISEISRGANISRQTIRKILRGEKVEFLSVKKICNYFSVDYKDYIE